MLYLFGVLIIGNIADILGKVHLGLDQFLDGYSREDVEMVQQTIISTYGNLRGKDYARKRNLPAGLLSRRLHGRLVAPLTT